VVLKQKGEWPGENGMDFPTSTGAALQVDSPHFRGEPPFSPKEHHSSFQIKVFAERRAKVHGRLS
jgi:hypothetical protein